MDTNAFHDFERAGWERAAEFYGDAFGALTVQTADALLDGAGVQLKAMMLLGINCGFGNADCASLPLSALNLETGWIDYPRPKTGVPRRC